MVEKPVLNNKGKVTSQREIRPVWNNAQRVNRQNKLTHTNPKRNFVPIAVATKSGQVPINAAKQTSPRAAASISTARHVNTATPKPKVNDALPITYSYFKEHLPVRKGINQKSAAKTNNFNEKVNIARVNNVTTARLKAVGNPQYTLQDQGIFDSGCSRHVTRNKSFLTDYQEIDGGFVAFRGSHKGGKIIGKALLRVPRQNNMYSFDLKNVIPSGGRKHALSFMRPFGCPVTILNTLDHLGKFDGKSDDGFFVGYFINSKAFRVFNTRTKFVEENLHINFLENKPNVARIGPNWMFIGILDLMRQSE
ncbi:ribonuclease H-like domain-containing protein [Tanacetum coccineum]